VTESVSIYPLTHLDELASQNALLRNQLQAVENRLRDFLDIAADWIYETDAAHRFTMISSRGLELLGLPPEQVYGRSVFEVLNAAFDLPLWQRQLATANAHKPFRDFNFLYVDPQGERHFIRASGNPRFDAQGRFTGYRGVCTDVTDSARSQAVSDRNAAMLRATFDHMAEGIAIVDGDMRVTSFNRRFLELLDLSPDRFAIGDPFEKLVRLNAERGEHGPGDIEKIVASRVASAREVKARTFARRRPNGTVLEIKDTPLPGGGFVTIYTDITERYRIQQELKTSEERFQDFAQCSADWFWETDMTQTYTYLEFRRLTGPFVERDWSKETLLGRNRHDLLASIDADPDFTRKVQAHMDRGEPFQDLEYSFLGSDGEHYWVQASGVPIRDESGTVTGYRGVGRDITGRKRDEALRDASEHRYRVISELTSDMVYSYRIDPDGTANLEWNAGSLGGETFIPLANKVPDVWWGHHAHPEDVGMLRQRRQRIMEGHPATDEFRIIDPMGTVRWLRVYARPDIDPDSGRVIRLIGGATDITERKLAEQALRRSEERHALLLAGANEGVYEWVQSQGDVLFVSSRFREVAGILGDEAVVPRAHWLERVHEEDLPRYRHAWEAHLAGVNQRFACEYRIHGDDGVIRWVYDRGAGLRGPEGIYRTVGALTNVTARKMTEIQLYEAKDRAETASRAKSDFLANMSHELRTPLNAVIGFSEILRDELFGPLGDSRYREYATDINDSGNHLLRIINDILDLSKAEAGKIDMIDEVIALSELFDSSTRLLQPRLQSAELTLVQSLPDTIPGLRGDRQRLRQILLNLLSNAVKFTGPGGTVTLSAELEAGGIAIKVADTGVGMSQSDLQKAMLPFTQIDSGLHRKYAGTGLGLPLTKSMVELHGGSMVLDSTPGVGTIVTVRFPAERTFAATAQS
jgi:PAS domain S-box-containing protein